MSGKIRGSAITASIWTMIQGAVYIALCSLAVQAYHCNLIMVEGSIPIFILYIFYFFSGECNRVIQLSQLDEKLKDVTLTFPQVPFTATRTYTWSLIYITLSSLWIITAFVMLFGVLMRWAGKLSFITTMPWVVVALLTLIADIVAIVFYAIDITEMGSFLQSLDYIGAKINIKSDIPGIIINITDIIDDSEYPGTWIPSAVFVAIFSRAGLFWLINLLLMVAVIQETKGLAKAPMKIDKDYAIVDRSREAPNRFGNGNAWPAPELRYHPNGTDSPRGNPKGSSLPAGARGGFRTEDYPRPYPTGRPWGPDAPSSMHSGSEGPVYAMPTQTSKSSSLQRPESGSALKNEFEQRMNGPKRNGPEELRSQLPWSYFQDRNGAAVPPRRVKQEVDDLPPVPVPDYTLHFPKRRRESDMDKVQNGAGYRGSGGGRQGPTTAPKPIRNSDSTNGYQNNNNNYY